MKVLALDPATKCGWAHSEGMSGVWDLSAKRDESKGMRLVRLHSKLREIYTGLGIDMLVFEAARNQGPKMQGALVVQAEMQGVIKHFCEEYGIEYTGVSPSEIKKHATGKGNANKKLMIAYAKARFPDTEIVDDNHADALHILRFAGEKIL